MRLIDADALKAEWYRLNDINEEDCGARFVGYQEIARLINNAPTVEPTGDLISRADAIEAVTKLCVDGYKAKVDGYFIPLTDALINTLSALPSAEPKGELISRADAICEVLVNDGIENIVDRINALSSAEAVQRGKRGRGMTREEAKEILTHNWTRVDNPNYSESELDEAFFMAIEALSAEKHQLSEETSTNTSTDLISRADAIALLTKIVFDEPPYLDSETLCRLYAEEQINALPSAEKQGKWIPTSEKLPKGDKPLLVTYSDGEVSIIYDPRPKLWIRKEHTHLITPIAWMPLPKPYREDGEA